MTELITRSIALIIPDFDIGGEEKRVVFFLNNYVSFFKKVYLIAPEGKSRVLLKSEIEFIELKVRNPINLIRVLALVRKNKIDFLQGHKRATLPYLFAAERIMGCNSVFNFDNIYLNRNRFFSYITPKNVVYLSDTLKKFYAPFYPGHRNTTINMGGDFYKKLPDDKIEKLRALFGLTNEFTLLSLGRLSDQKNQGLLIRALKQLNNVSFKALIVGTGPLEQELKALVAKGSLKDNIIFLGHRTDIEDLLNLSNVLIQSSNFEGFPNVLIEAASVGLPVVATNVGATETLVKDNGILIEPKDVEQLTAAIFRMIDHYPSYKLSAVRLMSSSFLHQFQKERMLNNYLGYYKSFNHEQHS